MSNEELRRKAINLATTLALEATERTGQDYKAAISSSLEEACKRLGIGHKEFIKMFI